MIALQAVSQLAPCASAALLHGTGVVGWRAFRRRYASGQPVHACMSAGPSNSYSSLRLPVHCSDGSAIVEVKSAADYDKIMDQIKGINHGMRVRKSPCSPLDELEGQLHQITVTRPIN